MSGGAMSVSRGRLSRVVAVATVCVLGAVGCSNRDDGSADDEAGVTTTAGSTTPDDTATDTTDPAGITFGDLASPCGPGEATIAEGQNGGDALVLATPTDRGAEIAPGLTQEMHDAAIAFASWCNEQGGIAGLPIEVLDADGRLFEVPKVMETVCSEAFAMVGGGWAFDDQQFPLFHECGMIDIAGYTVSTAKAMSNGMAQPIPNPVDLRNVGWFVWAKETNPAAMAKFATMYPEIPSTMVVESAYIEELEKLGGVEVVDRIGYNAAGEANWAPFAQRLKNSGATALAFVGSPEQFMPFMRAVREVGYEPELVLQEANNYSEQLLATSDAEGVLVRSNIAPFEEKDRVKAIADYLSIMDTYNPDGKVASLGVTTMSSYLLFATAANDCLASNGNVLERECVLAAVGGITGWTGGGLHAPSDPGKNVPTQCTLLLQVTDGAFTRVFPEVGSADDAGNGFACDPSWVMEMAGDYGDVEAGRDPARD
jgi:hypothetical protein